jgi:hypothetical protein
MRGAPAVALLAAMASCYGTPRTMPWNAGSGGVAGSAGNGGSTGTAGTAGTGITNGRKDIAGSGGSAGGVAGTSNAAGISGIAATGLAGTGGNGTGGSTPVFVGGPCVVTPDLRTVEVFGRSSDGRIYRRVYDGANWGGWARLLALDGAMIDARSDLDCSASLTSVHIVATGLNPVGAFLHAFGSGTAYNPFTRELASSTFAPGPSIADQSDSRYILAALATGATYPAAFQFGETPTPEELTPISTQSVSFRSGPDIAFQPQAASGVTYFAALDSSGGLSIYYHVLNTAGGHWADSVVLSPPIGTFSLSPAICTEDGGFGVLSVNVVAVAGGQLWYSRTSSILTPFSSWTAIDADPQSSPDCAIAGGADSIVHVVTLSNMGTVLDINGKGTTWVVTDLGLPPS